MNRAFQESLASKSQCVFVHDGLVNCQVTIDEEDAGRVEAGARNRDCVSALNASFVWANLNGLYLCVIQEGILEDAGCSQSMSS